MIRTFTSVCTFWLTLFVTQSGYAQKGFEDYLQWYPVSETPSISWRSPYVKGETILFEANPVARFSFTNNFIKGLQNGKDHTRAWYIAVRPQLRMYTDNSFPVKMPSYRVLLGTQHLFRLPQPGWVNRGEQFLAVSYESGHYSNGQAGCAFSPLFEDGSKQCDSVYKTITPNSDLSAMLNRRSGNFSTNLTEFIFSYQFHLLDDNNVPATSHVLSVGAVIYHDRFLYLGDFGGYSDEDIKIYGRMRYLLRYSYSHVFKKDRRLQLSENVEAIHGAHPSVEPWRLESEVVFYPFQKTKALGFFASYIWGHDNYNFRFVDSGNQVALGICWSQSPPIDMRKGP